MRSSSGVGGAEGQLACPRVPRACRRWGRDSVPGPVGRSSQGHLVPVREVRWQTAQSISFDWKNLL